MNGYQAECLKRLCSTLLSKGVFYFLTQQFKKINFIQIIDYQIHKK